MKDGIVSAINATRPKVKVIFEFSVNKPEVTFYRGVQATDGGYRMEKRGQGAKNYKPFMWCGSEDGLIRHRAAVEAWYGTPGLPPISNPAKAV